MFEKLSLEALVEELTKLCTRAEQLCDEIDKRLARLESETTGESPASRQSRRTLIFPSERGPGDTRVPRGADD